ncbi:protein root UVB sensitive 2, chloroplastic-like [Rutidosis leptorrhynchoides]|uniref:protein root UVB sensitive 2, chloroplastic-like n=1 Tax=Rutidosis leptorrhynchoides TaxID=125765 RepID=UPI003A992CE6
MNALNFLEKIKLLKKEPEISSPEVVPKTVSWTETSDTVSRHFQFQPDGQLYVKVVNDSRPIIHKVSESFVNTFFPSGYPYSVNEGYLRYTQFRALQHFSSAALSVLSTQSLLYAAGLRPTPAQATAVSWILKDGMQHMGKLICSSLGARMDSEPKRWRVFADVLYDLGTSLEVLSPLCPQLFLEMAGLGNFAKGMATVAARATRLPIYSSFAKEGNLSDLYAKGEAISTVFNVVGLGAGIQLLSTVCTSMQGKMIVGSLLSVVHVYSTYEEMRAAPINTLNPQRTAMIIEDFLKTGKVSSPADLRYREDLLFPGRVIKEAGNVKVGRQLHKAMKPSRFKQLKEIFPDEKFILNFGNKSTDMVLEQNASGEDALRGWLVAAYVFPAVNLDVEMLEEAYEKMNTVMPMLQSELQSKGWHTDRFLDGTGSRYGL